MDSVFKPKYLKILLAGLLLLYLYSLWGRVPDIDDAWLGESAFWQAKLGFVKSELMRGITSQENYLIVHHKLLTLQGAFFVKLFGFSLYSLKSIGLIYFILFLCEFYYYTVIRKKIFGSNVFIFSLILILSFPWVFQFSFTFRPEIMIMSLGFISYILLEETFSGSKKQLLYALLSGIFSGLCAAAHLNGLVVIGAGFILLLWNKKYIASLIFGMAAIITCSIYFYDFNEAYGFSYWLYQITQSPSLDSIPEYPLVFKPFINLLNEHQRFFHNPKIIIFSVFAFITIITGIKHIFKDHQNLLKYTSLLILLLGMLAMHKTRKYMLIYYPYLVIMISITFSALLEKKLELPGFLNKIGFNNIKRTLIILLIVFVISGFYYNLQTSTMKFTSGQNRSITEEYFRGSPKDANIIAPLTFIFNEIEYYNRIQGEVCYTELQKSDPDIYGKGFIKKAMEFDIDFIILTPLYREKLGLHDLSKGTEIGPFIVDEDNEQYLILSRIGN